MILRMGGGESSGGGGGSSSSSSKTIMHDTPRLKSIPLFQCPRCDCSSISFCNLGDSRRWVSQRMGDVQGMAAASEHAARGEAEDEEGERKSRRRWGGAERRRGKSDLLRDYDAEIGDLQRSEDRTG
eukprot:761625-Hanusia_phi.AAC.1